MDTREALRTIGLNDKEVSIYLALLQLGKSTAYVISRKSGLKNPTTYVILDTLIDKGLVRKVPRAKKQLYVAESPEKVFALAEEKLDLAKKALPELKAITKGGNRDVSAAYYEGVEGIKQLLSRGLKDLEGKRIDGFYAYAENIHEELEEYFTEYNHKLKKLKIKVRGIVPDRKSLKEFRESDKYFGRELKVVPNEKYSSQVAVDISQKFVRITDFEHLQGIIVENPAMAKMMKEIFEMVWENAPEI